MAQEERDWTTWTSFGTDVRRVRFIDDSVFFVTSGGVLAVQQPTQRGREYTNLNGLGTTDVYDLIEAADGQKWVAGFGRLIKFNGSASERYIFADNQGELFGLYALADDGDRLWVGTERGLILFSKTVDGGLILDNYSLFGDLPGTPTVWDIALAGDTIMLATDMGAALADKQNPINLKAPASWTTYSPMTHPELPADNVSRVVHYAGDVFLGTGGGVFRLDIDLDTAVFIGPSVGADVTDLKIERDSLFYYSSEGHGAIVNDSAVDISTFGVPGESRTGTHAAIQQWHASTAGGLYYVDSGGFVRYVFEGLPDQNVRDISIGPDGLITLLAYIEGPYELHNGQWVKRPVVLRAHTNGIAADVDGNNWVATWGGGASRVGDTVAQYTNANSSLRGVSENPDYVVVSDVVTAGRFAYFTLFRGVEGARVCAVDLDRPDELPGWTVFGLTDGIIGDRLATIDHFGGALAVGSQENGLYYLYVGSDPFSIADDSLARYYEGSPDFRKRLLSNDVRAVRFSPQGELWAGTNFGLTRLDRGVDL
ncbi:hypothetical protein GF377_01125, partial [candidate division GN15 bacterium]|nr:hypothetical protein [candidate division GN15 bacterium]